MEIISIIILSSVILVLLFFLLRKNGNQAGLESLKYEREEKLRMEDLANDLRRELEQERSKSIFYETNYKVQLQKLKDQEFYILELKEKIALEFQSIANNLLEEKSQKMILQNKDSMDAILKPLKDNIKTFEEKVEKVYKAESDERHKLEGALKEMLAQSRQIQSDANNLTKALRGDNKKQGNWGEVVLERILEYSGLQKDREYRQQSTHLNEQGNRLQPDVIIDLPESKNLIIDAKISLVAYEKWVHADEETEKTLYLRQHIQSLKSHIDGLSAKQYHLIHNINTPDFVLLFIPIEASFSATVQADHDIFQYAWEKKVVIVSPSTLLATLRTIASIWKVDRQNRHVFEIATEAGALYDKFYGFINDMESVRFNLQRAQKSQEDAFKKLSEGNGNIFTRFEKIKNLGAKANKQIDKRYLSQD